MAKYYIENTGGTELDREIAARQIEGSNITKHEQMECRDRNGRLIRRNLWEVPKEVADRIQKMGKGSGFQFVLYVSEKDGLPRNQIDRSIVVRADPFREARKERRKRGFLLKDLPHGVMRGKNLLAKQAGTSVS